MREVEHLSPTSISRFLNNTEDFYVGYLAEERPPPVPQTEPMAVGAAFDAHAKSFLAKNIINNNDPRFEFDAIFEEQVEPHNRDFAREHGKYVFDCYVESGAMADLVLELREAVEQPQLEFTISARVPFESDVEGIPLLGKPDVFLINKYGARIVYDFKVNGYLSKYGVSPKKGYVKVRDGWKPNYAPNSRGNGYPHKDCQLAFKNGVYINLACFLEDIDPSWADQLAIYAWLLGEPVGGDFVCGIEQLIAKPFGQGKPLIRCATHRYKISDDYQKALIDKIKFIWDCIQSGHIFRNMSREESDEMCRKLDQQHKAFEGDSEKDKWFTGMRG